MTREERKIKENLLISFSGGETSAYMTYWLWLVMQEEYNMKVVFANTGQETEETLLFVREFERYFNIPVVWVEAKINPVNRKPTTFRLVNFQTASREGQPFEDMIKKYGIPNQNAPHCTRELKQYPIKAYANSVFGKGNYYTAIGIRADEIDRMNEKRRELKIIYPLVSMRPMTKPKINFWWSQQPFRLNIKGYEGNCVTCWKKSDPKLFTIAKEAEYKFHFFSKMENRYGRFTPESRIKKMESRGDLHYKNYPLTFFRKNRSAIQMINEAKSWNGQVDDDSLKYDIHNESCEVFTKC